MNGSITFDGSLIGDISGGGGGGGDEVIITPVVTSGTKIADVSVNGVEKDLYCPTPPSPTQVDVTPVQQSGTKIASISINGSSEDLYAPSPTQVNVTQVQQSGTKIASIEVNGVDTDLYAPESGEVIYSLTERKIGKFLNDDLYEIVIDFGSELNFTAGWNLLNIPHENKYALIFDGELISTGRLSYHVDIASNDTTYLEIRPDTTAVGRYLIFKYTKNT